MARPKPPKEGAKLKTFLVSPGFILADFSGKRCKEGDEIKLDKPNAERLMSMGAITLDLTSEFADDTGETPTAPEANGEGKSDAGSASEPNPDAGDDGSKAPRRKAV